MIYKIILLTGAATKFSFDLVINRTFHPPNCFLIQFLTLVMYVSSHIISWDRIKSKSWWKTPSFACDIIQLYLPTKGARRIFCITNSYVVMTITWKEIEYWKIITKWYPKTLIEFVNMLKSYPCWFKAMSLAELIRVAVSYFR